MSSQLTAFERFADLASRSGDANEEEQDVVTPVVRSVCMSPNLALSVVDEVPHMIHLSAADNVSTKSGLKKSLSTSSLAKLIAAASVNTGSNKASSFRDSSNKGTFARAKTLSGKQSLPDPSPYSLDESISINYEAERLAESIAEIKAIPDEASVKNLMSGKKNDLLVGIVVSRWDNIVGPQCVYLWTEERTSTFYPANLPLHLGRLVKYVTDHTVDHHEVDGNHVLPSTLRSTLCIVRDLQLVYLSVSIRVPLDPGVEASSNYVYLNDKNRPPCNVPHSVAVLANLQYLTQFLLLRPLILNWLAEFSPKIGVLVCKGLLQNSMINSWSAELCKTIAAIKTCWGQESHGKIRHRSARLPHYVEDAAVEDSNCGNLIDYLPPPLLAQHKGVLDAVLASFLTTFSSAIIVGEDAAVVNQVIRFLLCFSKVQEAFCSRYVLPTLPDTFMKGLFVQGLMLGEFGEKSISFNQIATNRNPFTHVELSRNQVRVRQTNVQSHKTQRDGVLKDELLALWNSTSLGSSTWEPYQLVPKETCAFVCKFLEEMKLLSPDRRYLHLILFKRRLHCKAVSLISYLESISLKPSKERKKLLQSIPQTLGFEESEYAIVQVAAEKIRSGIMNIIKTKKFD